MENIDLRALRVLGAIYETGSLSRTAGRLELSQPAISITLAKLREHFGDQLFVRIGNEMRPTPQMQGLIEGIRASIATIEATLNYRLTFTPAKANGSFHIAMTDIGQIVMLPGLLNEIAKAAPEVRVHVSNINERMPQLLEAGEIDLAIGFAPRIPSGLYQQSLFLERFVCLVRSGHPRVVSPITKELYRTEQHIVVVTSVTSHLIIDRALEAQHVRRRVAVRVPNFLGLSTLIESTDYLCTLPRRAGLILAQNPNVLASPMPFKLPTYNVKQFWHERQARDPGNRWLRGLVAKLYGGDRRAKIEQGLG